MTASASARWRSTPSSSRRQEASFSPAALGGRRGPPRTRPLAGRPAAWESSRDLRPGRGAGLPRPCGGPPRRYPGPRPRRRPAGRAAIPGGAWRARAPAPSSTTAPPTLTLPEGHTTDPSAVTKRRPSPSAPWAARAISIVAHTTTSPRSASTAAAGVGRVGKLVDERPPSVPASVARATRRARGPGPLVGVVAHAGRPPRPRHLGALQQGRPPARYHACVLHEQRGHVGAEQRLHQGLVALAGADDVGERRAKHAGKLIVRARPTRRGPRQHLTRSLAPPPRAWRFQP